MNYNYAISEKSLIFVSIAAVGFAIGVFGLALNSHLISFFGLGLILLCILRFPAILVALSIEGSYLYFLALKSYGSLPESNITGAYYLIQGTMALIALVIYRYLKNDPPKILDASVLMLMIFLSYILAQYALLSNTFGAFKKLVFFFVSGIIPFFIAKFLTKELLFKSLKIIMGLAVILSLYSAIQIVINLGNIRNFFTGGIWGYHNQVYLLMTGIIIAICFYFFRANQKISIWWHIAFWGFVNFSFIESIIASSRGGIIGFILAMVCFVIYRIVKFTSKFKFNIRHLITGVLILIIFAVSWGPIYRILAPSIVRLGQAVQIFELASGEISEEESATSIQGRMDRIKTQYEKFVDNPIIGFGFGNNSEKFSYVHNMFLEVLFETGIIGFILFIGIILLVSMKILYIWKNSNRNFITHNIHLITITILWLYFLFVGLSSRSLFDNFQFWFFTGALLNPCLYKQEYIVFVKNREFDPSIQNI